MAFLSRLAAAVVLLPTLRAAGQDWPQFNLDAQHSGTSRQETVIHRGNVATLQPLYHLSLLGVADGAPAFLLGVLTPSGHRDLLFVKTKKGCTAFSTCRATSSRRGQLLASDPHHERSFS
jgi:hypothetical protein